MRNNRRPKDRQHRSSGSGAWRGRGWSPARSVVKGNHNFRGEKRWNGDEDPIGNTIRNRMWIKEDRTDQIRELHLNI